MGTYIIRRLLSAVLVVWAISVITFAIFFMIPQGDLALKLAGKNPTDELIAQINEKYHLKDPKPVQYWFFMKQIVTGELESFTSQGMKVVPEALKALPTTVALAFFAAVMWLGVGITFGNKGALAPGSKLDRYLMIAALIGISLPMAWLSLYSLAIWSDKIPLFPAGGYVSISDGGIFLWAYHLLLPSATLAVVFSGVYARLTRTNVRQALNEEYVKTAIAKGLPRGRVHTQHVLRTALIPIIVLFGLDVGLLMGGAIFTESIFGLPGLGSFLLNGISTNDVPVIMVGVLIGAVFVNIANIIVDIVQAMLDPRIRLA